MSLQVTPYMAPGDRYPALIGVKAEGDEYELAYVSKQELIDALDERDRLRELVRDMDYCLGNHMSCDQCEIRPCNLKERAKKEAVW